MDKEALKMVLELQQKVDEYDYVMFSLSLAVNKRIKPIIPKLAADKPLGFVVRGMFDLIDENTALKSEVERLKAKYDEKV